MNFMKAVAKISLLLFLLIIASCVSVQYYYIELVGFCDDYRGSEAVFNQIDTNSFLEFSVISGISGDTYMEMHIKNINQFKTVYIKEISCKIDDTTICLLKDKYYEVTFTRLSLGKIEKKTMKILLKSIGKNKIELPIIQEYILDNGDLICEENIYLFEYEKEKLCLFDK